MKHKPSPDLAPLDVITAEEAGEPVSWPQQIEREDSAVAKYCAVLEVEQPGTFSQALTIAMASGDYKLVPEDDIKAKPSPLPNSEVFGRLHDSNFSVCKRNRHDKLRSLKNICLRA